MSPEKLGVHAARRAKGYIYVSAEDRGPTATARTGAIIRNAGRGPPFIVVNHELSYVVATRWPVDCGAWKSLTPRRQQTKRRWQDRPYRQRNIREP